MPDDNRTRVTYHTGENRFSFPVTNPDEGFHFCQYVRCSRAELFEDEGPNAPSTRVSGPVRLSNNISCRSTRYRKAIGQKVVTRHCCRAFGKGRRTAVDRGYSNGFDENLQINDLVEFDTKHCLSRWIKPPKPNKNIKPWIREVGLEWSEIQKKKERDMILVSPDTNFFPDICSSSSSICCFLRSADAKSSVRTNDSTRAYARVQRTCPFPTTTNLFPCSTFLPRLRAGARCWQDDTRPSIRSAHVASYLFRPIRFVRTYLTIYVAFP